jgi:FKBP-type peptidyl-prolyl cis-trans isomerase (trigger factor)
VSANEPPIDPAECGLSYEAASEVHGTIRARVPAALVRRFRKKMRRAGREADLAEVKSELMRFLCHCAATEHGIRIVTAPMMRRGAKEPRLSTDHDFNLELVVDTAAKLEYPEEIPGELLEPEGAITDELVEAEMQRQRVQAGKRLPASEIARPSEVVLSLEIRLGEGERPIHSEPSLTAVVDSGDALHALGTAFAGAADALVGMNAGESRTIESVFPPDYPARALRGRTALLAVTVKSVAAIEPATVEEVLAQYGTSNEARLRTQIRFALEQQRTQSVRAALRDQMSRLLPGMFAIGVPECRARVLASRIEAEFRAVARTRGWNDDRADAEWATMRGEVQRECEAAARERVILQSIPAGGDVDVGEGTINARIADLAARRGVRPEEFRASLVKSGRYDEFAAEVIAEAMLDALVRKAKVRSVPEAEWRAAMEARRG